MLLASGAIPEGAIPEAGGVPAGLVDCSDAEPGIARVRRGKNFVYRDSQGRWIRDEATLARIRKLAIPPAYESVWICAAPNGHLQATGRDARGRKQYRYHETWRRRPAARHDLDPGRQRPVREGERLLRPDHPAQSPRAH